MQNFVNGGGFGNSELDYGIMVCDDGVHVVHVVHAPSAHVMMCMWCMCRLRMCRCACGDEVVMWADGALQLEVTVHIMALQQFFICSLSVGVLLVVLLIVLLLTVLYTGAYGTGQLL